MIDSAFLNYIEGLTYDGSIHYANANNEDPPYIVMYKIEDQERPETLCQRQGDSGRALFIFDCYRGGQNDYSANQETTLLYAENLKDQVRLKKGLVTDGTNTYRIWHNQTTGAVIINDGSNENNFFTARFTTLLHWEVV